MTVTDMANAWFPDRTAPGREPGALVPVAAGAAAFGLCCGLPVLASLGVAGVVTGLGVGSWLAVVVASIGATIGVVRWRHQRQCAVAAEMTDVGGSFPLAVRLPAPAREVQR